MKSADRESTEPAATAIGAVAASRARVIVAPAVGM